MKLRDILTHITACIRAKQKFVQVDNHSLPISSLSNGYMSVQINRNVCVESVSPNEHSLAGQAVKNFGFIVLRVHGLAGLELSGSVNGTYVEDVEFECTRLMLQETA